MGFAQVAVAVVKMERESAATAQFLWHGLFGFR